MEQLIPIPASFPNRTARTKAIREAAHALKTSVKVLSMTKMLHKPLESVMKREKTAKKALEHRKKCIKFAKGVVDRAISAKNAAKECGISDRQMARYITRVINEPEDDDVAE